MKVNSFAPRVVLCCACLFHGFALAGFSFWEDRMLEVVAGSFDDFFAQPAVVNYSFDITLLKLHGLLLTAHSV